MAVVAGARKPPSFRVVREIYGAQ
ncbi:hypothetical protein L195_g050651, partial [Trifolium pratense]